MAKSANKNNSSDQGREMRVENEKSPRRLRKSSKDANATASASTKSDSSEHLTEIVESDEEQVDYGELDENADDLVDENSKPLTSSSLEDEMEKILNEEFEERPRVFPSEATKEVDPNELVKTAKAVEIYPYLRKMPYHFKKLTVMYDLLRPGGLLRVQLMKARDDRSNSKEVIARAKLELEMLDDEFNYISDVLKSLEGTVHLRELLRGDTFRNFTRRVRFPPSRQLTDYTPINIGKLEWLLDPENADNRPAETEVNPANKRARPAGSPEGGESSLSNRSRLDDLPFGATFGPGAAVTGRTEPPRGPEPMRIPKATRSEYLTDLAGDDARRVSMDRRATFEPRRESYSSSDDYYPPTTQYISVGAPQLPTKLTEVNYQHMCTFRDAVKAARVAVPAFKRGTYIDQKLRRYIDRQLEAIALTEGKAYRHFGFDDLSDEEFFTTIEPLFHPTGQGDKGDRLRQLVGAVRINLPLDSPTEVDEFETVLMNCLVEAGYMIHNEIEETEETVPARIRDPLINVVIDNIPLGGPPHMVRILNELRDTMRRADPRPTTFTKVCREISRHRPRLEMLKDFELRGVNQEMRNVSPGAASRLFTAASSHVVTSLVPSPPQAKAAARPATVPTTAPREPLHPCEGCGRSHPGTMATCQLASHPDFNRSGKPFAESTTGIRLASLGQRAVPWDRKVGMDNKSLVHWSDPQVDQLRRARNTDPRTLLSTDRRVDVATATAPPVPQPPCLCVTHTRQMNGSCHTKQRMCHLILMHLLIGSHT